MKPQDLKPKDRLIVSIDVSTREETIDICKAIASKVSTVKIGLELLYSQGLDILDTVKSFGYGIMLDAKLMDIPNTVSGACKAISRIRPFEVTAHTLGGPRMIAEAKTALADASSRRDQLAPLLFGVTVLTSLDEQDLIKMGINNSSMNIVEALVGMSLESGIDGIVCSPWEVANLRKRFGNDFYLITPGIRLARDQKGDQKRVSTPEQAIVDGADFLVVGRSITTKDDVSSAIDVFLQEIERAS